MTKKKTLTPLFFKTYLAMILNSPETKLFKNLYARRNQKTEDIIENGHLACAFFVSSLLIIHKLISGIHATVEGTLKDLEKSGWKKIARPKIGCLVIWSKVDFGNNNLHAHIGFYIGKNQAISNSSKKGVPVIHNLTFNNKRKIELLLWHPKLEN